MSHATEASRKTSRSADGLRRRSPTAPGVSKLDDPATSSLERLQAHAGNRAVSQLLGGSAPLTGSLRAEMEAAFGTDFRSVRVHDNPQAYAAATAMHAEAFTRGDDVAFGRGRFAPTSVDGKRLLAHELAHVVQQRRGGVAPGISRQAPNEVAAERASAQVIAGHTPVAVDGASAVGVARAESRAGEAEGDDATAMMNGFRRWIAEAFIAAAGYAGPGAVLVAKANEGMSDQLFQELWVEGKGRSILLKMAGSAGFTAPAEAIAGYNAGVIEGMASPLTDMFGLAVFAENARNMGFSLLKCAYNSADEIGPEVQALLAASQNLARDSLTSLKTLATDPNTLPLLLSLPGSVNAYAQQQAYALGRSGASMVVSGMESPFAPDAQAPESPEFGLATALSWTRSKAGALHDWAISTPWAKVGENVGYAVGFVAIQVILVAMTAGIGEVITGAGAALGRLGTVLARISTRAGGAVTHAGEFVVLLGQTIGVVERAVGAFAGKLAAPLEKLLKPILDPVHELFESLLGLLRKVLGISERKSLPLPDAGKPAELARRIRGTSATHRGSTDIDDWPEVVEPSALNRPSVPSSSIPDPSPARIDELRNRRGLPPAAQDAPSPRSTERPEGAPGDPFGKTFTAGTGDDATRSWTKHRAQTPDEIPTETGLQWGPPTTAERASVAHLEPPEGGPLRPEVIGADLQPPHQRGATLVPDLESDGARALPTRDWKDINPGSSEDRPLSWQKHREQTPDEIPTDTGAGWEPPTPQAEARVRPLRPPPQGPLRPEVIGADLQAPHTPGATLVPDLESDVAPVPSRSWKRFTPASAGDAPPSWRKYREQTPDEIPTDFGTNRQPDSTAPGLTREQLEDARQLQMIAEEEWFWTDGWRRQRHLPKSGRRNR